MGDNGRGLNSPVGWLPTEAAPAQVWEHPPLPVVPVRRGGEMLHHNNQDLRPLRPEEGVRQGAPEQQRRDRSLMERKTTFEA